MTIEDDLRSLRHEIARLRHDRAELLDMMCNQYGPVAYRRWDSEKMRYNLLETEFFEVTISEEFRDEWEPLFVRFTGQVTL